MEQDKGTTTKKLNISNKLRGNLESTKGELPPVSSMDSKLSYVGSRDNLYETGNYPVPFSFNNEVANVFDNMVSRSVPLYEEVNLSLLHWFQRFYKSGTKIYDIGCSTGTAFHLIARHFKGTAEDPIQFVGIDSSAPMLEKATEKLKDFKLGVDFKWVCKSAPDVEFQRCSFSIFNYTLQFMNLEERRQVLKNIAKATVPSGICFISEKLRSNHTQTQESLTYIYESFKRRQGYSKNEIERKKEALDRVLVPLTENELKTMIIEAGFDHVECVMRWHNFASFVGLKN